MATLKEARAALAEGDAQRALELVLDYEELVEENFNSLLLKGTCYQRLGKQEPAEKALAKASELQPESVYPLKGLILVYSDMKNYRKMLAAFVKIVNAYEVTEDITAASNELSQVSRKIRSSNDTVAKTELLKLQLPGSPIYEFLKGRILPPALALLKLTKEEKKSLDEKLSKIKARARTSISMTHEKVLAEQRAVYAGSELAKLYRDLLAVTDDDNDRRDCEIDLMNLLLAELEVQTPAKKAPLVSEIRDLADGAVLFQPGSSPLAYNIHWEWADIATYDQLDRETIGKFMEYFPDEGLALAFNAFLHSSLSPFPAPEGEEQWTHQEISTHFSEALKAGAKDSVLALRMYADFNALSGDWEQAAQLANEARRLLQSKQESEGIDLSSTKTHLSLILGTAYVYYQAPKHFSLAESLFDHVLSSPQTDLHIEAQVGLALIRMEQGHADEATKTLQTVVEKHPDMVQAINPLARCEIEKGNYERGRELLESGLSQLNGTSQYVQEVRAQMKWRIGYSYWLEGNGQDAFDMFVAALQESPSYAPAFTYLGLFYDSQGDWVRAQKCFYTALEIDAAESIAAEKLATKFADDGEWDLVEIVAARLLESDRGSIPAWPYRALGIVSLAQRDYSAAVKYFQHCLRLAPTDANSWVGLSEAYIHSGRYGSANKALGRALELDSSSFSALYMLSLAQGETLQFSEAVNSLKRAMELAPDSVALIGALVNNHIKASNYFLSTYRLGDAVDHARQALETAAEYLQLNPESHSMWNGVALACDVVLQAQGHADRIDPGLLDTIALALDATCPSSVETLMILALEQALELAGPTRGGKAAACYNLASGYHRLGQTSNAIEQLKRALTLEPHNSSFWNLYGVVVATSNPRVAQHCFIRSLSLNGRSSTAWANLGMLYLDQSDVELASEAFDRALTVDPDAETAWLGQAILEFLQGEKSSSHISGLFEHAYLVSPGPSKVSKLLFGLATFHESKETGQKPSGNGIGALEQLLRLQPELEQALLVMGLLLERSGDYHEAISRLSDIPPSPNTHSHLARLYLATNDFETAKAEAQASLEGDADENVHLCAMLVQGLAHYFLNEFDEALDLFTAALEFSDQAQDVVVLLVQVLWAHGGDDERQVAIDNIYDSMGTHGSNLRMVLLLGVIGLLSNDQDVVDAIRDEINGQSVAELATDKEYSVPLVLSRLENSQEPFHRALFRNPAAYALWKRVDPKQALRVSASTSNISCQQLSDAYAAVVTPENAQRAVFYSPGSKTAWRALASSTI